jgi:integrase
MKSKMKLSYSEPPPSTDELIVPSGIKLNRGKRSESIRISFRHEGEEIRETLELTANKRNIDYVLRLRGEILNAISLGEYNHHQFFPNSIKFRRAHETSSPANATVAEMLQSFLSIAEKNDSLSSFNQYTSVCNTHLLPKWGEWEIRDVTAKHLREWIMQFTQKLPTVSSILLPLRSAMKLALDDEIISVNPFEKINLKYLVTPEQRQSEHIVEPFDIFETERILAHCVSNQERLMFKVAFATGMTPSEYIALRWADVHFTLGKVRITSSFVDGQAKRRGETGKTLREVDLRSGAIDALKWLRQESNSKHDLVFYNPQTGLQWEGDKQIRGRWKRLLKRAGVKYRNPYHTRHTFASSLLMLNHDPLYVAAQLGHTTVAMVNKTYGKWIGARISGDKLARLKKMYAEIVRKPDSNTFLPTSQPSLEKQ